jgi:cytochrome c oxidase assembly protein subunit 15
MSRTGVHRLAVVTVIATLALVAVGGFTRGSGSGFGCADRWPLCSGGLLGGLLPRFEYHMIIEWSHRWLAATVGLLALATLFVAWRAGLDRRRVLLPAVAAVVAIGIQAWLGRLVVKGDLAADLVSLHLGVSMIVVGLETATAAGTALPPVTTARRSPTWVVLLAVAAVGSYVLIILGSLVHNQYFAGWPIMASGVLPSFTSSAVLTHYLHRLLAAVGAVYLAYLLWLAVRWQRPRREIWLVAAALGLELAAAALGAVHVFTQVSSSVAVSLHLGLAGSLWAALVAATLLAAGASQPRALPEASPDEEFNVVGTD